MMDHEIGFDFEAAYERERKALLAYLYTFSHDYHLSEDLVQETLLIASQKREHYFPEANFGAWLRAIGRNVWLRQRRVSARMPAAREGIEDLADSLFAAEHYEAVIWEHEKGALAECFERLEHVDRELLRGHFSAQKNYAELAASAKKTVAWVKVRMFRARKALALCVSGKLSQAEAR